MKLSENFYLSEFVTSQTAARLGIDNTPSTDEIDRLKVLCDTILQPLRDNVGSPILISSGFRCKYLNNEIGSKDTSQHIKGEAADFTIPGLTVNQICEKIIELNLPFHQLINEFSDHGAGWVHVSIAHKNSEPRGEYKKAQKKSINGKLKTIYTTIDYK